MAPTDTGHSYDAAVRARPVWHGAFLGAVLLPFLLPFPADAQPSSSEPPLSLAPREGPPETVATVAGSACTIGARDVVVRLTDLGTELAAAETVADDEGRWELTVRIPPAAQPGEYTFLAECAGTIAYGEQRFRVLEPGEAAEPAAVDVGAESRTSAWVILLAVLGGLLFLAGIVLVVVERRRPGRRGRGNRRDRRPT